MSDAIDDLADALAEDPVLVDPLFGNGRTTEVDAALSETVEGADFPAYVVLVPRPPGLSANDPDRELATLLHERIGGDGVFLVQTDPVGYGSAVVSFGDVPEDQLASTAEDEHYTDGGSTVDLSPAGVLARDLEVLVTEGRLSRDEYVSFAEQPLWRSPPEWDLDYDVPTAETYAMLMTMAFVAVGGSAWLVLRTLARWRETAPVSAPVAPVSAPVGAGPRRREVRPPEAAPGPAEVRALAERELDALARRLAATAGRQQAAETRVLVDGSYDTARTVLERAGTSERDLDDLVGALVLTRVAERALSPRRKAPQPYRPCFFDPRHGEGVLRRTVPVGDRRLSVPACSRCGQAGGKALDPMLVPQGLLGRDLPWYQEDTVWTRTGYGAFVDDLWQHVAADRQGRTR